MSKPQKQPSAREQSPKTPEAPAAGARRKLEPKIEVLEKRIAPSAFAD